MSSLTDTSAYRSPLRHRCHYVHIFVDCITTAIVRCTWYVCIPHIDEVMKKRLPQKLKSNEQPDVSHTRAWQWILLDQVHGTPHYFRCGVQTVTHEFPHSPSYYHHGPRSRLPLNNRLPQSCQSDHPRPQEAWNERRGVHRTLQSRARSNGCAGVTEAQCDYVQSCRLCYLAVAAVVDLR